jgi:hypothetical protein
MWIYVQATGWLLSPSKLKIAKGYSGCGDDKNIPNDQFVPCQGPIPEGDWEMLSAINSEKLGPVVIPLRPLAGTVTDGRDDFYIHGDSVNHPGDASKGCIVQPRFARERLNSSLDRLLRVIAQEPTINNLQAATTEEG